MVWSKGFTHPWVWMDVTRPMTCRHNFGAWVRIQTVIHAMSILVMHLFLVFVVILVTTLILN